MTLTPSLRLAWQHEYLDRSHAVDAQFSSGGNGVGDCCDPTTPGFPSCVP